MTGLNNSRPWIKFDTDESCNFLLQTSPPKYVEKVSRYLASSNGQNGQNTVSCNPTEADSDSGDSLFITQKPAPLPVRSSTTRYNRGSYPTPPTDLAESEDDFRSSASHGVSKTDKIKKKYKLPAYSFPFLAGRKSKRRSKHTQILHNKILHNSAMGGFFKCVQKMWHGYESRDAVDSSLPTVDMETDPISPLSEEEEGSDNEDIKVVERNVFAVPLKRKSQQTCCKQLTQKKQRKATNTRQETSQGEQCKTSQLPAKATLSRSTSELVDTMSCDAEESACRVKAKKDELAPGADNCLNQAVARKTKGLLVREKKKKNAREGKTWRESEVDNPQKSQLQHQEDGKEAAATVTEPQTEVLHIDDLPQTAQFKTLHSPAGHTSDTHTDLLCEETIVKKRKKKKKDKDRSRSQEEVQGMNVTEGPLNEDSMLRQEEGDTSDLKEKKRKKREAAAENVNNLGFDLRVEDSVSSLSTEHGGKKKKKKSKRRENEEEQQQSSAVSEPLNDNAEIQKKHKKRRKEEGIVVAEEGNCLAASEQTLESSFVKRKKHKKKKHSSSKEASQHGRSSPVECVDGSSVNDAVETVETSPKKTKKKKKKTLIEGVDNSFDSEENKKFLNEDDILKTVEGLADQNAEVRVRKKKKKKRSEDNMVQSGDSMSVQEKSSSVLCADPESSPSLKAYVWGAEKPGVSAGNLEAESEEVSGNLEISNNEDRERKEENVESAEWCGKKIITRTKKKNQTQGVRGPRVESQTQGGKRTRAGNEAELMTPVESFESAADAGLSSTDGAVVLRKKRKLEDAACRVMHESPTAETEETGSTPSETPIHIREKKKKERVKHTDNLSFEVNSLTESAYLEPKVDNKKEKERTTQSAEHNITPSSPILSGTSFLKPQMSSDRLMKHTKVKRKLHNPNEDFLTDF